MSPLSKRILITPLDWGLGHATRCIPVIREFLKQNCEVQIATSGGALILLKQEFPELKFHPITSYHVEYSNSVPFKFNLLLQLPKFLKAIWEEHREIERIITQEKINLIISDNRYGCWSKEVKSVFICHQLNLKVGFLSSVANFFHLKAIQKFSHCWVPDEEGERSVTEELGINASVKPTYIGNLSRMNWDEVPNRYEVLSIISGPEPQRTTLEKIMICELKKINGKCLLVSGQPEKEKALELENIKIRSHLRSDEMNKAILESKIIVARSGYSTIMDLIALGKKAIFIPTPGQDEQEHLASRLMRRKIAVSFSQDRFNLQRAMLASKEYTGFERKDNKKLSNTIKNILHEIG